MKQIITSKKLILSILLICFSNVFAEEQVVSADAANLAEENVVDTGATNSAEENVVDTSATNSAKEHVIAAGATNSAKEHVIAAGATNFTPLHLFIEPGDTVRWVNMTIHDSVSMEGLIPEGAEHWASKIGQEIAVTLDVEGVYIYKCSPHYANGMVGAIIVGAPSNMNQLDNNAQGREKGVIFKLKKLLAKK